MQKFFCNLIKDLQMIEQTYLNVVANLAPIYQLTAKAIEYKIMELSYMPGEK